MGLMPWQLNIPTLTEVTWPTYVTSLPLGAWWRMRDTSGTTVVNSGSIGSAIDLTATAWTMAQAGQLGAGEAGLSDGATTRLQCANNATLAGYTTWEIFLLANATGIGEGNVGTYLSWGDGATQPSIRINTNVNNLFIRLRNTAPSSFDTITSAGIALNAWYMIFVAFDNAGDRKAHFYIGKNGAVTEPAYNAQPAMTGTYAVPSSTFQLMNIAGQTQTFAGLMDEAGVIGGRTFTAAERLQMTLLAGV